VPATRAEPPAARPAAAAAPAAKATPPAAPPGDLLREALRDAPAVGGPPGSYPERAREPEPGPSVADLHEAKKRRQALRPGESTDPEARPADAVTPAEQRAIYEGAFAQQQYRFNAWLKGEHGEMPDDVFRAVNEASEVTGSFPGLSDSAVTQQAVDILGELVERFEAALRTLERRLVQDELERFVDQFPDAPRGAERDRVVEALKAVLAEATGDRAEDQLVRNFLVNQGLDSLPSVTVNTAHFLALPGIDADRLPQPFFTVADAVTGWAGPGDDTTAPLLFVVRLPEARDLSGLSGLPGLAPGTLMFRPGTRFRVTEDRIVGERRTVELIGPGAGPQDDDDLDYLDDLDVGDESDW
jgi:hypothetical protein